MFGGSAWTGTGGRLISGVSPLVHPHSCHHHDTDHHHHDDHDDHDHYGDDDRYDHHDHYDDHDHDNSDQNSKLCQKYVSFRQRSPFCSHILLGGEQDSW